MSGANLLRLVTNEWLQEVSSKIRLGYYAGVALLTVVYMTGSLALPVYREQYVASELYQSLADRFPGYDDLTLVRMALTDTLFPALLTILAALWPGSLTTMSLTEEKDKKTLECLLLAPTSEKEVLIAKSTAAALPAVAMTWLAYGTTVLAAAGLMSGEIAIHLLNPRLILVAFFSVPALAVLSALGGMVVSLSVVDSKTALGLGLLPGSIGFVCFVLVWLTNLTFSTTYVLIVTLLIAGMGVLMLGICVSLFDREKVTLGL